MPEQFSETKASGQKQFSGAASPEERGFISTLPPEPMPGEMDFVSLPPEQDAVPFRVQALATASLAEVEKKILAGLNPEQREAVSYGNGPLLILAGAGSGKTRVITHRMAWLVAHGVHPAQILAITFTNKAATEMKERLSGLLGPVAARMWVGTFHSMMLRILRRHAEALGFGSNFTILDTDDQQNLLKRIMKEQNIDDKLLPVKNVHSQISAAKNKLIDPQAFAQSVGNDFIRRKVALLYEAYQKALKEQNSMDFDDILTYAVELFRTQPQILAAYQERFLHVLVDEYQDTNHAQYILVRQLSAAHKNLCVVGDDDQSIYSFRGANLQNILDFEDDFKGCKLIKLEQNYRSSSSILEAANAVISRNEGRKQKRLWTAAGAGGKICFYAARDQYDEARWVAREVLRLMRREPHPLQCRDMAILYRVNALSRNMEFALRELGVPYQIYGGLRFYDRKEIRDTLAWLRVIASPEDRLALLRAINSPRRGIGQVSLERIEDLAAQTGKTAFEIMEQSRSYPELSRAASALTGFTRLIRELQADLAREDISYADFIAIVQEKSGLEHDLELLRQKDRQDGENRLENLRELRSDALEFEHRLEEELRQLQQMADWGEENPYSRDLLPDDLEAGVQRESLAEKNQAFLERATLYSDLDSEEGADAVSLMTIHSAKGLEFEAVFLIGAEEGLFPGYRVLDQPEELEEERRLAYVAITRAKKRLSITAARSRLLYGSTQYNPVSRFLSEIPDELVEEHGGSRRGDGEVQHWDDDESYAFTEAPYHGHKSTVSGFSRSRVREYRATPSKASDAAGETASEGRSSFFAPRKAPLFARPAAAVPIPKEEGQATFEELRELKAGARVRHARYGEGDVRKNEKLSGDVVLSIEFDGKLRHMMASMAKLEILSRD